MSEIILALILAVLVSMICTFVFYVCCVIYILRHETDENIQDAPPWIFILYYWIKNKLFGNQKAEELNESKY